MYSYELTPTNILFRSKWLSKKGVRETKIPRPTHVSENSLNTICGAVIQMCQRGSRLTAVRHFSALRKIFCFAQDQTIAFPNAGDPGWRKFIYEHYIFHLSNPGKRLGNDDKDPKTMRSEWSEILNLYKYFKQKKIVPRNLILPLMNDSGLREESRGSDILDSTEEHLWNLTNTDELWPKTFLIDKDLNTPTDKFLEKLQSELEKRTEGIIQACQRYWNDLMYCQKIGSALIKSIPLEEIESVLDSGEFYIDGRHIAHPLNPNGLAWFLAVIDYYFYRTGELKLISYNLMKKIPFLRPICNSTKTRTQMNGRIKEAAGKYGAPNSQISETLNRLLGHLSPRDCAAAASILIAENPKFTPRSLEEADYLSTTDKPIHYYNSELGCLMWSVSKPRATARKVSALPPRSRQIYTDLVRITFKARLHLILEGNNIYRKLFLTSTHKWVGMCTTMSTNFNAKLGIGLYSALEPELQEAGVSANSFCLRRIRGTQGLIAFLKEGTYQAVANTLGNSIAIVKKHYIPKWLMQRWNIRIVRIFQSKLIILATKNRPWQEESSDFITKADLFKFVVNSAVEAETSDPISVSLKQYATEITENAAEYILKPLTKHKFILKIDPLALASIFLFSELHAEITAKERQYIDKKTGISAESILTLAQLFHATHSIINEENHDNPIITNIAGFSTEQFQHAYNEALKIKLELAENISTATVLAL